ncbi:virulence factor MviN [Gordonibacter sp. 28C]|uniref:lipid II flippase MurJ n=1 Tax=Gordonibacter sp. 28C TaxID=2078569 RepID=UPI000DF8601E|nr:lipid II flippase MurJ [Gordonibacter sp. 28C]RDB60803.1 virulence factor MviN [Gordonibacter sp. 28C]
MSDKLARAQHTRVAEPTPAPSPSPEKRLAPSHARAADPGSTSEIRVGGRHAGLDRTVIAAAVAQQVVPRPEPRLDPASAKARLRAAAPGETSEIRIGGSHAGVDRTTPPRDPFEPQTPDPHAVREAVADPGSTAEIKVVGRHTGVDKTLVRAAQTEPEDTTAAVGSSAALMSVCVMLSRITGFARTWVMAFALGSTLLSSSYQVANNLPNQLYELVVGGMLVTAFLPVYMSVKKKLGRDASNRYASNLLTIVVLFLGIVSALCIAFPSVAIYTQSFYSDQNEMTQSVFFFQFFAIQIVMYGATAIVSGLLNANRDYLWSSIAPVANNVIVIATFVLYAVVAPQNQELALYIIAFGNPLGVFVQLAIQLPALKKNGIRIRPRIDFRDPALRETVAIGVPAVFVMLCSLIVVSVQSAASYSFADNGPSILLYARQWFTLPYAFLAVPITTAMFTELADMQAEGNTEGVKRGIVGGTNQILFFMIPFALYLMVFALPLVSLYHAGAFTMENVSSIATYMAVLAFALPVYGVNTYLQKIFSSLRKMGVFAAFNFVAGAVQIALTMFGASNVDRFPIEIIAVAEVLFYVVADVCLFAYLRGRLGPFGLRSVVKAVLAGIVFGGLGAALGGGVLYALTTFVAPLSGSIPQALAYVVAGGMVALVVTFGLAIKLHVPEAAFVSSIAGKVAGRLGRG